MILSWYEKKRDEKDHIYFIKRQVYQGWKGTSPYQGFHHSVEFIFGLKGRSEVIINDNTYSFGEGDVIFIDSFDRHRFNFQNGTECYVVLISASFFNAENELESIAFPIYNAKNENFEILKTYLDFIYTQFDSDSLLCKTAFANTLAYLMKKFYPVIPKKETDKQYIILLEAIKYISENYFENITVEALSRKFGYTPNYFSAIFKKFVGMPFREYLNMCRIIEYNKFRRQNSGISVSKAAEICGFGSTNSFYRAYNKYMLN